MAIANDSQYGLSGGVWSGDQDRVVAAAREAFPAWSRTPVAERARAVRALADGLAARTEYFELTSLQLPAAASQERS